MLFVSSLSSCLLLVTLLFAPLTSSFTIHASSLTRTMRNSFLLKSAADDLDSTRDMLMGRASTSPTASTSSPAASPTSSSSSYDIIKTLQRSKTTHSPTWLFRQAGRHLPEYTSYKKLHSTNFLKMLKSPQHVSECTLQPIRRYSNLSAAILFSDILVVPQALNITVTMPGGVGIQVPEPLTCVEDVVRMSEEIESRGVDSIVNELSYVYDSVKLINEKIDSENLNVPLLGFSASPYTLFYYMVGGTSKKNQDIGSKYLKEHPKETKRLLNQLNIIVNGYVTRQVEAGAKAVQIFEALGGTLGESEFKEFCLPVLKDLAEMFKRDNDVPVMIFAREQCGFNGELEEWFDGVTIDTKVDLGSVKKLNGVVQGGFNPSILIGENNEENRGNIWKAVEEMFESVEGSRYIANLGEGMGGKENVELVQVFLDAVREVSGRKQ